MKEEDAYYLNQKANDLLESENYKEAIEYYLKAIEFLPDEPIFYHNMGVCFMMKKDYFNASKVLQEAINKNIGLDETIIYLANSLYELEDYRGVLSLSEPKGYKERLDILILKAKSAMKVNNKDLALQIIKMLKVSGYESQELDLIEKMVT